jgi:hypothetical protein
MQKSRHFFRFQKIPEFHMLVLMKKITHFLGKLDLAFRLIPNLSIFDAPSKFKKINNLVRCASGVFFDYSYTREESKMEGKQKRDRPVIKRFA